jgi:hypothetical protein
MPPQVSIVLPAYNAEAFLSQSIKSLLSQTLNDFEVIAIDDGSTDATASILQSHAGDGRLRIFRQENRGVIATLNKGLELATGEFVARMDADDVAHPLRLEKQMRYMRQHPEVGILGTAYRLVDDKGRDWGAQPVPPDDLSIRWTSLLTSPFVHPAVMMRRSVLQSHQLCYSADAHTVEDYDLFARLLGYTQGANLHEPLLLYRVHGTSNTGRVAKLQRQNHPRVAQRQICRLLPDFVASLEQVAQLQSLFATRRVPPDVDRQRATLAEVYLDMWLAFARQACHHARSEEVDRLRRRVIGKAARIALRPPLPSGWIHVVERLWSMDPTWPMRFMVTLPWSALMNLRWQTARHLFLRHHGG